MTEPNALTLDIASVFLGQEQPTEEVPVVLNAGISYAYATAKAKLELATSTEASDKEIQAIEKEIADLEKAAKDKTYVFHIATTPRHIRENIRMGVLEEFPLEFDLLNRVRPNPAADEKLSVKNWTVHIKRIVGPSGEETTPTEADIAIIRGNAPDPALEKIDLAIAGLYADTENGWASLVDQHDFLSQP